MITGLQKLIGVTGKVEWGSGRIVAIVDQRTRCAATRDLATG